MQMFKALHSRLTDAHMLITAKNSEIPKKNFILVCITDALRVDIQYI
jgi:hypothetical protein